MSEQGNTIAEQLIQLRRTLHLEATDTNGLDPEVCQARADMVNVAAAELTRLQRRVQELELIVERLPKTADGVPVIPQLDTVWSPVGDFNFIERVIDRRYNPRSTSKRKNGWWTRSATFTNYAYDDRPVSECYSTRDAACRSRNGDVYKHNHTTHQPTTQEPQQ